MIRVCSCLAWWAIISGSVLPNPVWGTGREASSMEGVIWLLDRVAAELPNPQLERQVQLTHPVGSLFLQLHKDGRFVLSRGLDAVETGKWELRENDLTLEREVASNPALRYRVRVVEPGRLVLELVLPKNMPPVRLEFMPSEWPRL